MCVYVKGAKRPFPIENICTFQTSCVRKTKTEREREAARERRKERKREKERRGGTGREVPLQNPSVEAKRQQ